MRSYSRPITAHSWLHGPWQVRGVLGDHPYEELVLLGAQWIVPKVVATDKGVQHPQPMHTDIPQKGELLSVALHAHVRPRPPSVTPPHPFIN